MNEKERLSVLHSLDLISKPPAEDFERIVRLAQYMFGVPVALISLVGEDRVWHLSSLGTSLDGLARRQTFCQFAIQGSQPFVVEDAWQNPAYRDYPALREPTPLRFYAGAPLILPTGQALGSLCVMDAVPRQFDETQRARLSDLAHLTVTRMELLRLVGRVNAVTALANRQQFDVDLQALSQRSPGQRCTLLLIDTADIGLIYDAARALGLDPVDDLQRSVAARLRAHVGQGSRIYHIGAARFGLLLPAGAEPSPDSLDALAKRLRQPFAAVSMAGELTVHIGIVPFTFDAAENSDVLRRGYAALHDARAAEHGWARYDAQADAAQRRAYALLFDVPRALDESEFFLVYQPKIDVDTGAVRCVEALIRWRHARYGMISPAEFIPIVERTTMIHALTNWVIRTALAQQAQWRKAGWPIRVAINVSARNLEEPGLLDALRQACLDEGCSPDEIEIECTETAAMGQGAIRTLNALHAFGACISLDDFGTGQCNFSYLRDLPASILKLDRSLIHSIADNSRDQRIVEGIIHLAHDLSYRLAAEGVENQAVFDRLKTLGCDQAQGYYIAPPLDADKVLDWLAQYDHVA